MRRTAELDALAREVEQNLAQRFPTIELVDLAVHGGADAVLTLFIDRPGGVDLDTCAAVSGSLDALRERYTLEVSSPGLDRPLTKPAHFSQALGAHIAVRVAEPVAGRSNFRGQLTAASDTAADLAVEDGGETVRLEYENITRARVIHTFDDGGRHG